VFAQKPRHDRMVNLLILHTQNFKNQTAHKHMFVGSYCNSAWAVMLWCQTSHNPVGADALMIN
jgi:hypothetical protein